MASRDQVTDLIKAVEEREEIVEAFAHTRRKPTGLPFERNINMVLPLLLSDPSTVLRYGDLGRTVLHCLHVVHSMERALSIFFEALTYVDCDNETTPPSCSLSSFDAHVGDCACQTRAQMFWDLFTFYRKQENKQILSDAITELRSIKASTALLLEEIELSHGKPRNPKLILLVNHMAVWERIGFHAFLELAVKVPEEPTSVSKDITEPQGIVVFLLRVSSTKTRVIFIL